MTAPAIRRALPDDAAALTSLMLSSSAYTGAYRAIIVGYPVTPAMIARNEVWLAEEGGWPVGFYGLDLTAADLDLLFVADEAHGRGSARG